MHLMVENRSTKGVVCHMNDQPGISQDHKIPLRSWQVMGYKSLALATRSFGLARARAIHLDDRRLVKEVA